MTLAATPWILIDLALCFAAWGFFYHMIFRRWHVGYIRHFELTTIYFLLVAGIASLVFWRYLERVLARPAPAPLVAMGVFMLCQLAWYLFLPKYASAPAEYFVRYPDRYFLQIDVRRLVSKSADILAQQALIIPLVLILSDEGLSLGGVRLWFGCLFMLLHVPLIASERGRWPSWLFAATVIAMSVVFPTLILFVQYGFVYNMMLHWLFYTATGTVFAFRSSRRDPAAPGAASAVSGR